MDVLLTFLATFLTFLGRNPLITKMLFFSIFVSIISFAIDFLIGLAVPYLTTAANLYRLLSYFGIITAINLFFSILISGWAVKQVLAFVRT